MSRPVVITTEAIVAAAKEVFLERGIRATTAEVAMRAGVSEGSIFKRFRSKFELFQAAMSDMLAAPKWIAKLQARAGKGDLRANLNEIGVDVLTFMRELMPLMMMSWSNPTPEGLPAFAASDAAPAPIMAVREVAGFFDAERRAGRLRPHDPEVVARVFLGSITHYVVMSLLQRDALLLTPQAYVEGVVDLLLTGVERTDDVREQPRPSKASARTLATNRAGRAQPSRSRGRK